MFFAIGFVAACAISAYILQNTGLLLCMLLCLLALVICLAVRNKASKIAVLLLLGACMGFGWMRTFQEVHLSKIERLDDQTVQASVEVSDYSYETYYGAAATGRICLDGKEYRLRVYVNDLQHLQPGDILTGEIKLEATTAGGAAESDYHQGNGLFLVGYLADGAVYTPADEVPLRYYPAVLRNGVLELIDQCFPEDTLAFARALLLGDTQQLTYEEDSAYKVSGIRHVIAVSGLHVSILFSLLYMVAGKRRLMTALLGIPGLLLFAAIAGFTPSVLRACGMQMLMILALLLNKDYDPPTALATAVLGILLCNPMSIYSVSLQLSAGCMVGIFLFCDKIQKRIQSKLGDRAKGRGIGAKMLRWCAGTISVTLSAMFVTTPLCAYYFGVVSLVGIVTNLMCLWVISVVFYGIMISCALGALWLPAGQTIAGLISFPIRMVQGISKGLSAVPFAAIYTRSPYVVAWLVLAYLALILFVVGKRKRVLRLVFSLGLSLIIAIGAACLEPIAGNYIATVIDVGQGQCVHLRCGNRNYLVDCGSSNGQWAADAAAASLLSQGINRLDGIIVTHYDADHVNGVQALMSRISTDQLYLPDTPDDTEFRSELEHAFPDKIIWVTESFQLGQRNWNMMIFSGEKGKEGNESSLCVLFQREECDILITGDRNTDGEVTLLDQWRIPKLEVLVAGHHGSYSSTSLRLLSETRPDTVVISVGAGNTYNHPDPRMLGRLEMAGCKILRTDLAGDIHIRR